MRFSYRIWQIMLAVGVCAGLFAVFGVTGSIAVLLVVSILVLPVIRARPGRRLCAMAWVASLYPVCLIGSLSATWFTAWGFLGHRPRLNLDDPKYINPVVLIPHDMTFLLLLGSPAALLGGIVLAPACAIRILRREGKCWRRAIAHVLLPLLVWTAWVVSSRWNLFDFDYVNEWFWD
ncbi:MAG: hypothetical protein ACP5XB_17050 [Isosphaeraceae bacterium]